MKTLRKIIYAFMALLSVCITVISLLEPWIYKDVSKLITFAFVLIYLLFIFSIVYLYKKLTPEVSKLIILGCFIFTTILQLIIVFNMKLIPKVDLGHIYKECISMLDLSNGKITNVKYFGFYTNNIPITILLYWIFRLVKTIGFTDYRLIGGIFNVVMLQIALVFAYKVLIKLTHYKTAGIITIIILTNPIYFAYASYFYTDTITLPFLLVGFFFIIKGIYECRFKKQIFYHFIAGILICIGMKIRVTTIFIGLAVFTCLLIEKEWKHLFKFLVGFLLGLLSVCIIYIPLYRYHITFNTYDSAVTAEHFLMMASTRNGTYNEEDVFYTKSFNTHEDKVKNNVSMWKQRIKENGLLGNIQLIIKKQGIVWGIGTRGYVQYTQHVEKKTFCYEIIVGKYSNYFKSYMQAYNIVLFLYITLGVLKNIKNGFYNKSLLLLCIYWGGATLFYAFWEAHPRHAISFLILLTFLSIPYFNEQIENSFNEELKVKPSV